jgi:chemotaxis protein methyltransferase CheR
MTPSQADRISAWPVIYKPIIVMVSPDNTGYLAMDPESFTRLSTFVTREYGIKLPLSKKSMLESRLNKKVKSLGLKTYSEFLNHIFSDQGTSEDLLHVVDLITTNKTDFFRERHHFDFLTKEFLTSYMNENGPNLKIWSAGCSSGEEPYTLVMSLEEYRRLHPEANYSVLASDISIRMIQTAFNGIYTLEKIAPVPADLKSRYFLRSRSNPDLVRIKPEYRKRIQFRRINFMDDNFGLRKSEFDVIFCRNVLIYFNKRDQDQVLNKFCAHLRPGGLLFLGHSESIIGMDLPLKQIRPTVFQYQG